MKLWDQWVKRPFLRVVYEVPWFGPVMSTVVVAMAVNIISEMLMELWKIRGALIALFGMAVPAIIFIYFYHALTELTRRPVAIKGKEKPRKRKGLIALVSNEPILLQAIHYHQGELKCCWLIVTERVKKLGVVEKVKRQVPSEIQFEERGLQDEYDAKECYAIIQGIYQNEVARFGLEPKDVIADITGGTKPMTMGMILACIEGEYPVEHVPAVYDENLRAHRPLDPIEIRYDIPQIGARSTMGD